MRIAVIGGLSSTAHAIEGLIAGKSQIVAVCGLDSSHAAHTPDYYNLSELAGSGDIPYLAFDQAGNPDVVDFLTTNRPDLLLEIGLTQTLPEAVRSTASQGVIGYHPRPLPEGRGQSPYNWTILLGTQAAATLYWVGDEYQAGPIIDERFVPTYPGDCVHDLVSRTNKTLQSMMQDWAHRFRHRSIESRAQEEVRAAWYGRLAAEDSQIDWTQSADTVSRQIRAWSHPFRGAYTYYRGEKITIWQVMLHGLNDHFGMPGQIVRADADDGLLVQCGDGHVWLTDCEGPNGEKRDYQFFGVGGRFGVHTQSHLAHLEHRVADLEKKMADLNRRLNGENR